MAVRSLIERYCAGSARSMVPRAHPPKRARAELRQIDRAPAIGGCSPQGHLPLHLTLGHRAIEVERNHGAFVPGGEPQINPVAPNAARYRSLELMGTLVAGNCAILWMQRHAITALSLQERHVNAPRARDVSRRKRRLLFPVSRYLHRRNDCPGDLIGFPWLQSERIDLD